MRRLGSFHQSIHGGFRADNQRVFGRKSYWELLGQQQWLVQRWEVEPEHTRDEAKVL